MVYRTSVYCPEKRVVLFIMVPSGYRLIKRLCTQTNILPLRYVPSFSDYCIHIHTVLAAIHTLEWRGTPPP